jgi:hypothetical protein
MEDVMSGAKDRGVTAETETFIVDRAYLRGQFGEALRTFIAPLAGVYGAASGKDRLADKKRA